MCYPFFPLTAKGQTRIYLFVFLLLQKIRRRVLVSSKVKLEICLVIPEVSLIFSQPFQNLEATFGRCSTKIVVQQNHLIRHSSAQVVKSRIVLDANLLKTELHHKYFSKNLTASSEIHLDGYF